MDRGVLGKARGCVRDDGIGDVLEQSVFAYGDVIGLGGWGCFGAWAVDSGGAGGCELDGRCVGEIYVECEFVAAEQTAGNVMQVEQRGAVRSWERANRFERGVLVARAKAGAAGGRGLCQFQLEPCTDLG